MKTNRIWWGFSKKRNFSPSDESLEALETAEKQQQEALSIKRKALKLASELNEEYENNHFKQRYLKSLRGTA